MEGTESRTIDRKNVIGRVTSLEKQSVANRTVCRPIVVLTAWENVKRTECQDVFCGEHVDSTKLVKCSCSEGEGAGSFNVKGEQIATTQPWWND
jgi:hypothetical protein